MARRALDTTGDLLLSAGRSVLVTEAEEVRQRWVARMRFFLGEWFRDQRQGFPWADLIASKNLNLLRQYIARWTSETTGVDSVTGVALSHDTANRTVAGEARFVAAGEDVTVGLIEVLP